MLINGVDTNNNNNASAPEAFYVLDPSDNTKVRIKIIDATLFTRQVKLKPLFCLLPPVFWEWNAKHINLWHLLRLKPLLRVLGPRSLSIMLSLDQFQK